MRKHKSNSDENSRSLRTFFFFCFIVILLILISFSIRLFFLFRDSSFDGTHRYTLEVRHSARDVDILTFEPKTHDIGVYTISSNKNINDIESIYGIPVDGVIRDSKKSVEYSNIIAKLYSYMLRVNTGTGVNSLDIGRLILFTYGIDRNDIKHVQITDGIEELEKIEEAFFDKEVIDEGKSIAIVNASAIAGIGTQTERLLTSMGANVVSVTTAPTIEKVSKVVYDGTDSYTLKKVVDVTGYPLRVDAEPGISDILIIIGEDSLQEE